MWRATSVWSLSMVGIMAWNILSNGIPANVLDWHLTPGIGALVGIAVFSYYAILWGLDRIATAIEENTKAKGGD